MLLFFVKRVMFCRLSYKIICLYFLVISLEPMKTLPCKLTAASIKHLKDQGVQLVDTNETTLYFRYKKKNKEKGVFYYRHYANSTSRYIKLGPYPELSVADAKKARITTIRKLSLGESIAETQEQLLITVGDLIIWYLKLLEMDHLKADNLFSNTRSLFKINVLPYIGNEKITHLTKNLMLTKLYSKLTLKKIAISSIELVMAKLSAALNKAAEFDLIKKNPIPKLGLSLFTNDRPLPKPCKLQDQGLDLVVAKMANSSDETRMMIYMLALFGVRVGELSGARWTEVNFEARTWIIPKSRTKTKLNDHIVYLPVMFANLLRRYKRTQLNAKRNSLFLFPQRLNKKKHISGNSGTRRISRVFKAKVTAHDFRKNASDWWIHNGVDYYIVKFLLNHVITKMDKTYIQGSVANQCHQATLVRFDFLLSHGFFAELKDIRGLRLVA
jgi:integrase